MTEFLTPAEQTSSSSSFNSELIRLVAGVGALRGGSRDVAGRGPTRPRVGLTGAMAHPEFAKGVETRSGAEQVL